MLERANSPTARENPVQRERARPEAMAARPRTRKEWRRLGNVWKGQRQCAAMRAGMAPPIQDQVQVRMADMLPSLITAAAETCALKMMMKPEGQLQGGEMRHNARPFKAKKGSG